MKPLNNKYQQLILYCFLLQTLLKERVNVNLADYKGATALHRAKDSETFKVLPY